jgi:hypothetical protein
MRQREQASSHAHAHEFAGVARSGWGSLVHVRCTAPGPAAARARSAADRMTTSSGGMMSRIAYDRAGWSEANVAALTKLGVKKIGLAPRGRAEWKVCGKTRETLISERAQVEGGTGGLEAGALDL